MMLLWPENFKNRSHAARKHGGIDQGKYKKGKVKKVDRKVVLCSGVC